MGLKPTFDDDEPTASTGRLNGVRASVSVRSVGTGGSRELARNATTGAFVLRGPRSSGARVLWKNRNGAKTPDAVGPSFSETPIGQDDSENFVVVDIAFQGLEGKDVEALKGFSAELPLLLLEASADDFKRRAMALAQAYPLPNPIGELHLEQYRKELVSRQAFVKKHACLTAAQVAETANHDNTNRSQTASRWKSDGKIFAIPDGRRDLYPAFQFGSDGQPISVIAEILKHLQPHRSPWSIARWFTSPNSWLNERAPNQMLDTQAFNARLIDAAEQEVIEDKEAREHGG